MIFHNIFSVKSLTFVPFCSITKYYWHFMIFYCDKQNFSVCYRTILPLRDIGKYFAIIKQKVIFPISQILTKLWIQNTPFNFQSCVYFLVRWHAGAVSMSPGQCHFCPAYRPLEWCHYLTINQPGEACQGKALAYNHQPFWPNRGRSWFATCQYTWSSLNMRHFDIRSLYK